MEFSLRDYNLLISKTSDFFPRNFFPYIRLDRKNYSMLEKQHENSGLNITDAFRELKKRTGRKYFDKVYPAQSSALSFSERTFPAYRFLLPEVLVDDWLGIIDFHKKYSRDHALHQPMTAYIVHKLLGGGISKQSLKINDKYLLDLCVNQIFTSAKTKYLRDYVLNIGINSEIVSDLLKDNVISREFWKSLFFETAFVSAIFHDIGYPWQYIYRLNHSLSTSNFTPNSLGSNSNFIYNTFKDRLILYPFNGYKSLTNNTPSNWKEKLLNLISTSLSRSHGFPGALGFLYLNDVIREFPSKKEFPFNQFCVEWAALGIMMHDLGKIYNSDRTSPPENSQMRLEFDKDPLSCIITLADLLEEFERPNVDFTIYNNSSKYIFNYFCLSSKITFERGILNIEYNYKDKAGVAGKLPFIVNEEKEFFDPDYGYLDFSSIGIKNVKLQALVK